MMALLVAVIMCMAMAMPAMAATISVQNVIDGEQYTAYKILNYRDNDETGTDRAVSYYLTSSEYTTLGNILESAGFHFTATSDGSEYFVDNASTFDAAEAAEYLGSNLSALGDGLGKTGPVTGASGEANFTGLGTGYFFVTSTAGSLCALHEDTDIATVVEKNTIPTVDKTQSETEGNYADDILHENVGDVVYYQLEVTDGTGTDAAITLTDTMTDGLTYNEGTIKINGSAVADNANTDNWQVTVSGQTITIVFKAAYVATVDAGAKITVTYNATINENAVVDSATGNKNEVTLTYSNQSQTDQVYVETYDVTLKKTDGTNALSGAKFNLFTQETGGTALTFSSDDTGYYLDASGNAEIDAGDGSGKNIRGLEPGTYWFEETVAPNGYNKLASRTSVTVTSGATAAAEVTVVNNKGAELPSTGGIGTTIFYVVGALLVVGAGVLLVTRRRMRAE